MSTTRDSARIGKIDEARHSHYGKGAQFIWED